jgi:hypothetical protein
MMNKLLGVIALAALVGTFAFAPAPAHEPVPRSMASRPTPSDVAAVSPAVAVSHVLPSQQPPVPLVRAQRAVLATATSSGAAVNQAEVQPQDGLDKTAARTAIEADGYKGVTVLGKKADGTWRAKAYRGKTEIQVTVDGTGRVSAE